MEQLDTGNVRMAQLMMVESRLLALEDGIRAVLDEVNNNKTTPGWVYLNKNHELYRRLKKLVE